MKNVIVIGAGLAGCEAAYQLANLGFCVKLYEMKKIKRHDAFKTDKKGIIFIYNIFIIC